MRTLSVINQSCLSSKVPCSSYIDWLFDLYWPLILVALSNSPSKSASRVPSANYCLSNSLPSWTTPFRMYTASSTCGEEMMPPSSTLKDNSKGW